MTSPKHLQAFFITNTQSPDKDEVEWNDILLKIFNTYTPITITTPPKLENKGKNDIYNALDVCSESLQKADFVIAQITTTDSLARSCIAESLLHEVPIFLFSYKDTKDRFAKTIIKKRKRYVTPATFKHEEELKKKALRIARNITNHLKSHVDKKFILQLSPEFQQYLEWNTDQRYLKKSDVIRMALQKQIENDLLYQESLKEQEENILKNGSI